MIVKKKMEIEIEIDGKYCEYCYFLNLWRDLCSYPFKKRIVSGVEYFVKTKLKKKYNKSKRCDKCIKAFGV